MHTSEHSNQEQRFTSGEHIAESILNLLDEPDSSDKQWRAPFFQQLPKRLAEITAYRYKETYIFEGRRNANQSLLKTHGKIHKHSIPLNASDDDLKELARRIVKEMLEISRIYHNLEHAVSSMLQRSQKYAINLPSLDDPSITVKSIYTRLTDENWWLRRLHKVHAKKLEQQARDSGLVHQRKGSYISDETLQRGAENRKSATSASLRDCWPLMNWVKVSHSANWQSTAWPIHECAAVN